MREILVINLTRMGDLLQTTPLMSGLKEKHPGSRITLLVNTAFAEICEGIPFIDELLVFDMKGYRKRVAEKKYSLVENYKVLEELTGQFSPKEYDLTINVTHSPISAILTSFVRTKEIRGFTIDSEGHRVIRHPWVRYFFNVVPNRIYNPLHLVDMYLKIGGVIPERKGLIYDIGSEDDKKASLLLKRENISEGEMLIGFHLGASKSDKTWPVSSYAALADLITSAFGAKVLLFGSPGEADLAAQFELKSNMKPVNFVGRTSIGELAALLRRCRLFISNDTGPLHIATSVGTRVIDISTGNVHFMETGPYGAGHYVIQADLPCVPCGFNVQCRDMVCKSVIEPSAVFEVVRQALVVKETCDISNALSWKNLQVYKSHFKDDGYIEYVPLIRHPLSRETFYRILYRQLWNLEPGPLNGKADMIYESIREEISHYGVFDHLHETIHSIRREIDILSGLVRLSEEGAGLIGLIAEETAGDNRDIGKIKDIWKGIETVDKEIELIGHTNPCFKPIVLMFTYAKEALEGDDLRILAEASRAIYTDLLTRSENMLRLMTTVTDTLEMKQEGRKCELTAG